MKRSRKQNRPKAKRSSRRSNPGRETMSRRVETIDYVHAEDGRPYRHRFKPGTHAIALANGDVLLHNPRGRVWEEFSP